MTDNDVWGSMSWLPSSPRERRRVLWVLLPTRIGFGIAGLLLLYGMAQWSSWA